MKPLLRCAAMAVLWVAATSFGGKTVDLFVPTIRELTATPLSDAGVEALKVAFEENGSSGCNMDPRPGAKTYDAWFEGSVDEAGKFRFDEGKREGGSSEAIAWCTRGVIINNRIRVPPGRYRLAAKVTFKKIKYELTDQRI